MGHYPPKFLFKAHPIDFGVFTNTGNTYEDLAHNAFAFRIVKGDDVSIGVVMEVCFVKLEKVTVRTEDVAQIGNAFLLVAGNFAKPGRYFALIF